MQLVGNQPGYPGLDDYSLTLVQEISPLLGTLVRGGKKPGSAPKTSGLTAFLRDSNSRTYNSATVSVWPLKTGVVSQADRRRLSSGLVRVEHGVTET